MNRAVLKTFPGLFYTLKIIFYDCVHKTFYLASVLDGELDLIYTIKRILNGELLRMVTYMRRSVLGTGYFALSPKFESS